MSLKRLRSNTAGSILTKNKQKQDGHHSDLQYFLLPVYNIFFYRYTCIYLPWWSSG